MDENLPPLHVTKQHVSIQPLGLNTDRFFFLDFVFLTLLHSLTHKWQSELAAMVMIQMC